MAAVGAVLAIVVVVTAAVVLGGDDGGHQPEVAADTTRPPRPTTTGVADLTAADAFAQAGERLESAGSFSYAGTSRATDVSPVRPGVWLAVDLTVTGDADLATGRFHEVGESSDGQVTETVSDGITVWGRRADTADTLADQGFLTIGTPNETPVPLGAGLVPTWLASSIDYEELPGTRLFRATLPADVLGTLVDGTPPAPAELQLTLDAAGDPTHVEVSVVDGPLFHLSFDITQLGTAPPIELPT